MTKHTWTDAEILAAIQGNKEERNAALQHFFTRDDLRHFAMHYVKTHQGNEQDGEDIFQDAVVIFDRKIRAGQFEGKSSLRTFFISIVKFHWIGHRRKYGTPAEPNPKRDEPDDENPEILIMDKERANAIEQVLEQIGERCKEILKLYKLALSMAEIAQRLGISSPEQAKRDAYRCRMRFRDFVNGTPHLQQLLNPS